MQRFARIADGLVAEIVEIPDTLMKQVLDGEGNAIVDDGNFRYEEVALDPRDVFVKEIADALVAAPAKVEQGWSYQDGKFQKPEQPVPGPEPEPGPVILYPADLWRRSSEDEAEQIEAAMNAQSARLRNLFRTAQTYQSNDPLWPVLLGAAVELFGEERAAELLAPSV